MKKRDENELLDDEEEEMMVFRMGDLSVRYPYPHLMIPNPI
jgi:hypothetical protein